MNRRSWFAHAAAAAASVVLFGKRILRHEEQGPDSLEQGEIRLVDYSEGGRITLASIVRATQAANGRPVLFPGGQTIVLSAQTHVFEVPVDWRVDGQDSCTIRIDQRVRHDWRVHNERWLEFRRSVRLDGIHFDGSGRVNKIMILAPQPEDSVELLNGSAYNALQPASRTGVDPVGGFAACIASFGRFAALRLNRFHLHHVNAMASPGGRRPNSRGIDFSPRARGRGSVEGGPRHAEILGCEIHDIAAGGRWGTGDIEADGIVWRTLKDGRSRLDVIDCRFWSCAKRPFKANVADNWRLLDCTFAEYEPGHRYRYLSAQQAPGQLINPRWEIPDASNWPSVALVSVSDIGSPDDAKAVEIVGAVVRVKDSEPITGATAVVHALGESARVILRDTSIAAPGGVEQVLVSRMAAQRGDAAARRLGARMTVDQIDVEKVNGAFVHVDRSGRGTTYQRIELGAIRIAKGIIDPRSVRRAASNVTVELLDAGSGSRQ